MMWDVRGHWDNGGGWEGWLMFAFMIIVAVAVVVAIVYLIRYLSLASAPPAGSIATPVPPQASSTPESPKDILKRRYAAGEIDREDYLQRLNDL